MCDHEPSLHQNLRINPFHLRCRFIRRLHLQALSMAYEMTRRYASHCRSGGIGPRIASRFDRMAPPGFEHYKTLAGGRPLHGGQSNILAMVMRRSLHGMANRPTMILLSTCSPARYDKGAAGGATSSGVINTLIAGYLECTEARCGALDYKRR